MWIINNFPAYDMLFGWGTKGKLASSHCMEAQNLSHLGMWVKVVDLIVIDDSC